MPSRRLRFCLSLLAAAPFAGSAAAQVDTPVTAPGPQGALAGTMLGEGKGRPVVLIVPGSGPTDRDGNSPLGVVAAPYRLLAEALAARGVASVRVDKRGMFGSKAAVADANAVTVADYAADVHAWARTLRARTGAPCVWVLGHSEGGVVALAAAQDGADLCGVILVSTPGRALGLVIRDQFRANPANAPLMPAIEATFATLEKGGTVDHAALPAALQPVFPPQLDGYFRSFLPTDPAALLARYKGPVLIVQGTRDLQVPVTDAQRLAATDPRAALVLVEGATHVLKHVATDDRAANIATYSDASLPLAPEVVTAVAAAVTGAR